MRPRSSAGTTRSRLIEVPPRDVAEPAAAPAPRAKLVITMQGLPEREVTLDRRPRPARARRGSRCPDRLGVRQPLPRADRARRRPGSDARPGQHQRSAGELAAHPAPSAAASRSDPGRTGARHVLQRACSRAPPSRTRARRSASRGLDFRTRPGKRRRVRCSPSAVSIHPAEASGWKPDPQARSQPCRPWASQ